MPYEPRTSREVERALAARVVARSALTDLADGSVIRGIVGAVAQELAGVELRLARIRDSFYLDGASGVDLDERVGELPSSFALRLTASAASGLVLLTRASTGAPLVVPAGAILGRSDDATVLYQTVGAAIFGGPDATATANVVATTPGAAGNCAPGTITRLVTAAPEVVAVTNTSTITNGQDQETDEALRTRAYQHLSGLAQCQPGALEGFALAFISSLGQRVTFARIFEDHTQPGYSELIVDDGSGFIGASRPGAVVNQLSGVGQIMAWHEAPAVGTPRLTVAGSVQPANAFVNIPERGIFHLFAGMPGFPATWTADQYQVYTGIIAELQAAIEARRAAGTRVRVLPPSTQNVFLSITIVPRTGVDAAVQRDATLSAVLAYLAGLGPGEPLMISRLIGALLEDPNLLNLFVREPDGITPASDVYPPSARFVLRGTAASIVVGLAV